MSPVLVGWDPAKDRLLSGLTITQNGVKVGPCLVNGKIGQGGMGAVYRARHTMLNLDVAVKILPFHLVEDNQSYVQRFQREAQAAAVVSHQNLVRVFEMGCEKDIYFLILEFVNGESAHARLARKKRLDEGEALRIIRDASVGLAAAHSKGIIHRDVKPDNILVGQDGTVKLADLGLAKISDADFAMTLSNVAMGTPQFMSPEQIKNSKAVTASSDIWAMGVSLYYLLTGQYPFNAENLMGLLNIINDATPSVIQVRSEIAPGTQKIINKCLEKKPEDRYRTALDLVAAIDEVLLQLALPSDLTVPAESCLAAKLGPYTPSGQRVGVDSSVSPGSDAPTLLGQGPTSNRTGSRGPDGQEIGPAGSDGSYTSTLKLPPKGAVTAPLAGALLAPDAAPVSTSAVTAAGQPAAQTIVTGATTIVQSGGRSKLVPVLIALLITLPITGYGLYWGLKVKPYNDAVASAQAFETKNDFLNAATAWKAARDLSPTEEATAHATQNEKLAGILDQLHKAESAKDWPAVLEQCDAFLRLKPDFGEIVELRKSAVLTQRRTTAVNNLEAEMAKLRKATDWDFRSSAWEFRKRLVAALVDYPDDPTLKRDFAELALRFRDLDDLTTAVTYLADLLKRPNLESVEKTHLEALQERVTESRQYAYLQATIRDPLDKAREAATKRLEAMVENLESPKTGYAAALAILTAAETALPNEKLEGREEAIAAVHEAFEKEFLRLSQKLSYAAQRANKFQEAYDAIAGVYEKIDPYYQKPAKQALVFLPLMVRLQALRAQPLKAVVGFAQDGNGRIVAPKNLPNPDLLQIRLLRIVDADHVVAVSDGRLYTTTLEFQKWEQVTDFKYNQESVMLAPDLRLMAQLYDFTPEKDKTPPPDARSLAVFETAGESQAWVHSLVTTKAPVFAFSPDDKQLLMIGHAVDKIEDQIYSLDVGENLNSWDFFGRGWRVVTGAAARRYGDLQWLPDGQSFLYGSFDPKKQQYTLTQLEIKTGTKAVVVERNAEETGALDQDPGCQPMPAVDPGGSVVAVYSQPAQRIDAIRLSDRTVAAKISAKDVDLEKTGAGMLWSADGQWLVYRVLDGATPVFKVVGVQREGDPTAPDLSTVPAPEPKGTGIIP